MYLNTLRNKPIRSVHTNIKYNFLAKKSPKKKPNLEIQNSLKTNSQLLKLKKIQKSGIYFQIVKANARVAIPFLNSNFLVDAKKSPIALNNVSKKIKDFI